jgi:hypothetical protein
MSERRGSVRYSLWLPVIFRWVDDGEHARGGFTRDISTAGVFVVTSECPPANAHVSMEVVLQSFNYVGTVRLEGMGKVTRVEGTGEACTGFALCGSFDEKKWTRLVDA